MKKSFGKFFGFLIKKFGDFLDLLSGIKKENFNQILLPKLLINEERRKSMKAEFFSYLIFSNFYVRAQSLAPCPKLEPTC